MSALLMGRVFYTQIQGHLKLTLLALADHAEDDGSNVKIGQARLARKVGASERAVRGHIAELRQLGYIEKVGRVGPRGQDRHRLIVEKLPTSEQIALLFPYRPATDSRPATSADRQPSVQSTGNTASVDRQPASANPSENHQKNHQSAERARDPIWDGFVAWLGRSPETKSERGQWNKACGELRAIGVDNALEVERRGRAYQRAYSGIVPTPLGLVAHWSEFGRAPTPGDVWTPSIQQMTDEEFEASHG
ncbi:MAG: helix-turn-helix domain-containing protein [Actinomycetota bacterium]|nr:helix-turn-helix domain-containing protein [Actinomycetota bacterium]